MAALAVLVLAIHLTWILWVIVGALFTRGRPWLTGFHIASLTWGIIVDTGPWPCPLTMLEQWLEARAGLPTYSGSFMVHYLDAIVYPNVPVGVIIGGAIAVCGANLLIYLWRLAQAIRRRRAAGN
ncbi:MAG: DUF2784 domain-containing protein [Acidobacteriaceae bacterium]